MAISEKFNVPIPDGFRIYEKEFDVAGLSYYRKPFLSILKKGQIEFGMQPDPKNKHDKNAIKVVGCRKGIFGRTVKHIGYLPSEISSKIHQSGVLLNLCLRPKYLWVGDEGGLVFKIELMGPSEKYKTYESNKKGSK